MAAHLALLDSLVDSVVGKRGAAMNKAEIIASATHAAFGRPRVNNVLRAMLVEAIVDAALGYGWEWCSGDWSLCDFRHADGTRLEVKQSAARQCWHQDGDKPSAALFDIAPRKQAWDGLKWVPSAGRNAPVAATCRAWAIIAAGTCTVILSGATAQISGFLPLGVKCLDRRRRRRRQNVSI